jgi:hypothetical protein
VIDCQSTFRHHLLKIPIAQRVPQIPSHAQNDNVAPEMSPTEQCWLALAHLLTLPDQPQSGLRHNRVFHPDREPGSAIASEYGGTLGGADAKSPWFLIPKTRSLLRRLSQEQTAFS